MARSGGENRELDTGTAEWESEQNCPSASSLYKLQQAPGVLLWNLTSNRSVGRIRDEKTLNKNG